MSILIDNKEIKHIAWNDMLIKETYWNNQIILKDENKKLTINFLINKNPIQVETTSKTEVTISKDVPGIIPNLPIYISGEVYIWRSYDDRHFFNKLEISKPFKRITIAGIDILGPPSHNYVWEEMSYQKDTLNFHLQTGDTKYNRVVVTINEIWQERR